MIQDTCTTWAGAIAAAHRKTNKKPGGYVIHRGTVNGQRFAAVATLKTDNRKTGDMVQIWFVLEDMHPVEAVARGIDVKTICRGCPFASGNGCYVNVGQAPLAVWRGLNRGIYPELNPFEYSRIFAGRKVRFGAYGNPTLLPISKVKAIAEASKGWTGYFHDWRENPMAHAYAAYFMASTETEDSRKLANAIGFRTFHVSPDKPADAIECLSDAKGLTCAQCKLCAGLSKGRQPSVWINPHGSKKSRAISAAMERTVSR